MPHGPPNSRELPSFRMEGRDERATDRPNRRFSDEFYDALMRTPFWAISVLLHAVLYLILYHALELRRPLPSAPIEIEAFITHEQLDREDAAAPKAEDTRVEAEPVPPPELVEESSEPEEEDSPLDHGEDSNDLFRGSDGNGLESDGIHDLGFGSEIWGTEFGEYVQNLRTDGLDVTFVFDSTSSMSDVLDATKRNINWMISVLHALVPDFRLGIVTYRDYGDEFVVKGESLSRSRYRLLTFLDTIRASGGGDPQEAVLAGLRHCRSELAWSQEAKRVLVLIGDAPPHDREARRAAGEAEAFRRDGGIVHAVITFDPNNRFVDPVETAALESFQEIAKKGGGSFSTLARAREIVPELLVLSFGEEWRSHIETAYENVSARRGFRNRMIDRLVRARQYSALVRKLRITPVYPALVDALVAIDEPALVPLILETLQDDEVADESLWAGVYVLERLLGLRITRLPRDPRQVLAQVERLHRQEVGGQRRGRGTRGPLDEGEPPPGRR